MILIIDTTKKECLVGLYDGKKIDRINWSWQADTGSEVLKRIEQLLKKHRKTIADIQAILVNRGPGSYTGTRVGIVIANTLGWQLSRKAVGFSEKDFSKKLKETWKNREKSVFTGPILPIYQK